MTSNTSLFGNLSIFIFILDQGHGQGQGQIQQMGNIIGMGD